MNSNKGITLVALVITIIIVLILASTATYVGYDAIKMSAEQRFLNQLKEVNEAVNLHLEDYNTLGLTELETTITYNEITYNFKLQSKEDYEKLGLYNIEDTIYVNFELGKIYSESGINGKHTLEDFGVEYYNPTHENEEISDDIYFNVSLEPQDYSWKYTVNDESIVCNGEPSNGNLFYSEYIDGTNHSWKRVNKTQTGYELEVKEPGIYELKFRDSEGKESDVKQVYAYVKDGLQLYYDGEYNQNYKHNSEATTWTDLSGNGNDGIVSGCTWNEKYLYFDGTDDWINCGQHNYDEITLDVINEYEKVSTEEIDVFCNYEAGGYGISLLDGYNGMSINLNGTYYRNLSTNSAITNKIYSLKASYDKNKILFYENSNQFKVEISSEIVFPVSDTVMAIGTNPTGLSPHTYYMKGKIYNVKIYKRALSEEEIQTNYNIDKIRYNISE